MADLIVSAVVSGAAGLDVAAAPHSLWRPGVVPGVVQRERIVVESPWVDDDFLVHSKLRRREIIVRVKTKSASIAALQTAITALTAAFTQTSYTFTVTTSGTTWAWNCEAATEYGPAGGELDPLNLMSSWQLTEFTIPAKATAAAGPY